jgi:hypothetical protein
MKDRRRFRPVMGDRLERRLALRHGGPITPALIGTLSPTPRASGPAGRVAAQANQAFDSFTQDYSQAQGAYLSSGTASGAFEAFTTQRVNLLAQQLTRIFARLPGSFAQIKNTHQRSVSGNSTVVFQAFLFKKINGNGGGNDSLLQTLNSPSVVPPAGTKGAAATLYTLTATNAIQSARIATINAVKYIANDTFKNSGH